ncbi:MAG TPA: tRNA (adenosine(37)-N6)-threonylcarbamoyltransferase complex dimerization subunit type 1 TsaB [Pseudonocardiaceae bacterium]|nr:tRNA (adenosine(37)-N6)-threonylcarbamoyltransferase complex dimerization subunit type 1 TsaB [Pseudonocardiaceae bacterium]
MIVLAIDTATPAVTAGVVRCATTTEATTTEATTAEAATTEAATAEALATRVTVDARAHGELLTPHITAVLAEAEIRFDQVDAIVCGIGPGPFTGLRVGMVTAASLGHALGVPVYGVCSLDAIAAEASGDSVLVVTDARRREVYWAHYRGGRRVAGPEVTAPAELPDVGATVAAGDGARIYADVIGLPVVGPAYPSPAGLVSAAGPLDGVPAEFRPLYLRRPDAVEPGARKKVSAGPQPPRPAA